MKLPAKAVLTAFLLTVGIPQRSQSGPMPALGSTFFMPHFALHQPSFTYTPPIQSSPSFHFPSIMLGENNQVLPDLMIGYHAARSDQERTAYLQQIIPLVVAQTSEEWTKTSFHQFSLFSDIDLVRAHLRKHLGLNPQPPEQETYDELQQQQSITEVTVDFENLLGYSPFESNEHQAVRKTMEGYIIHDLVEQRIYHIPYHSSLEVALITDEASRPLFQTDGYGTLVPVASFSVELSRSGVSIVSKVNKGYNSQTYNLPSEIIASDEEFNKAYPPPSGCGGTASGIGLVLLPLAAARSRRKRDDLL